MWMIILGIVIINASAYAMEEKTTYSIDDGFGVSPQEICIIDENGVLDLPPLGGEPLVRDLFIAAENRIDQKLSTKKAIKSRKPLFKNNGIKKKSQKPMQVKSKIIQATKPQEAKSLPLSYAYCGECKQSLQNPRLYAWHMNLKHQGIKVNQYELVTCPVCKNIYGDKERYCTHLKPSSN
ncbi:hypothetical protein HYX58_01940 [Candidatus Dependentiae bacterium]|nr:hypothetical protein [Candidatus Dependentiae bacterium]